jgi:Ca-activated chloride channel family protein
MNSEVALKLTVYDKKDGLIVKGLSSEDFGIYSGKTEQKIKTVIQQDNPVSIGILVDLSGSMDGKSFKERRTIDLAEKGLTEFIKQANPLNEYFILGFGVQSTILLNNTQNSSEVLKALGKISEAKPEGNTAFYDAVYRGFEKLSDSKFETRVLLSVTDGQDNSSKKGINDILQNLKQNNVTIYFVSLFDSQPSSFLTAKSIGVVDELCEISGGWNFVPEETSHIGLAFTYIAEILRNQYKITFDLKYDKSDRAWHKLKVKLVDDELSKSKKIKVRQGIYIEKDN